MSHAIQGIYVSCCKTSLHWTGKMCSVNMYRFFCKKKNYFLQQLFPILQQLSEFLARFEQHPDVMPQNKFLLPTIVMRATIWTFVMTFCFHDVFKYYGAWKCGPSRRNDTCYHLGFWRVFYLAAIWGTRFLTMVLFQSPYFRSGLIKARGSLSSLEDRVNLFFKWKKKVTFNKWGWRVLFSRNPDLCVFGRETCLLTSCR